MKTSSISLRKTSNDLWRESAATRVPVAVWIVMALLFIRLYLISLVVVSIFQRRSVRNRPFRIMHIVCLLLAISWVPLVYCPYNYEMGICLVPFLWDIGNVSVMVFGLWITTQILQACFKPKLRLEGRWTSPQGTVFFQKAGRILTGNIQYTGAYGSERRAALGLNSKGEGHCCIIRNDKEFRCWVSKDRILFPLNCLLGVGVERCIAVDIRFEARSRFIMQWPSGEIETFNRSLCIL